MNVKNKVSEVEKYLKRALKNKISINQKTVINYLMLGFFGLFSSSYVMAAFQVITAENGGIHGSSLDLHGNITSDNGVKKGYEMFTIVLNPKVDNANAGSLLNSSHLYVDKSKVKRLGIAIGVNSSALGNMGENGKIADNDWDRKGYDDENSPNDKAYAYGRATAIGFRANADGIMSLAVGTRASSKGAKSVALGPLAEASHRSVALGHKSKASETQTIAIGEETEAKSQRSIAIGLQHVKDNGKDKAATVTQTIANGEGSIAIGSGTKTTGDGAIALGLLAEANKRSVVLGERAKGYSNHSIALGNGSQVESNSDNSIALGINATVETGSSFAIALGNLSKASKTLAIALGSDANSKAEAAISIGARSSASNANAIAIGLLSNASGLDGIAIGNETAINSEKSVAIGYKAKAFKDRSVAIGSEVTANKTHSIVIGDKSNSTEGYSVVLGSNNNTTKNDSVAIGKDLKVNGSGSVLLGTGSAVGKSIATQNARPDKEAERVVAIGNGIEVLGDAKINDVVVIGGHSKSKASNTVAIGNGADTQKEGAVSIGRSATTKSEYSIALGSKEGNVEGPKVETNSKYSIAVGTKASVSTNSEKSIAIGYGAKSEVTSSIVIGDEAYAHLNNNGGGANSITIGKKALTGGTASNKDNIAIGTNAKSIGNSDTIVIGHGANTDKLNAVAIGTLSNVDGKHGIAIGGFYHESKHNLEGYEGLSQDEKNKYIFTKAGENAVAIGRGARAIANKSIALGERAKANESQSIAIGDEVEAKASRSIAIGFNNNGTDKTIASGQTSIAIGSGAMSKGNDAIALGRKAISNTASVVLGGGAEGKSDYSVALGYEAKVDETNSTKSVAIGHKAKVNKNSTEAVVLGNNSQATGDYTVAIGATAIATEQSAIAIGASSRASKIKAVAIGHGSKAEGDSSISLGYDSNATKENAIGIGYNTKSNGKDSVALGINAVVSTDASKAIALGNASKAEKSQTIAIGDQAEAKSERSIAIGLKNPADTKTIAEGIASIAIGSGAITNGDDAIALGRLAEATKGSVVLGGTAKVTTSQFSVAIGQGAQVKNDSNNAIAIGLSALVSENSTGALALGNSSKADSTYAVALGSEAKALQDSSIAIGRKSNANGADSIAIGLNSNAGKFDSIAIGNEASVTGLIDSVAIGKGSKADETKIENVALQSFLTNKQSVESTKGSSIFSVGSDNHRRVITNVGAGSKDTDAVNVAQLKSLAFKIEGNTNGNGSDNKVDIWNGSLKVVGEKDSGITTTASDNTITIDLDKTALNKLFAKIDLSNINEAGKKKITDLFKVENNGNDSSISVTEEVDSKSGVKTIKVGFDESKLKLKYKANGAAVSKETALSTGLDFKVDGKNLTITAGDNGQVTFNIEQTDSINTKNNTTTNKLVTEKAVYNAVKNAKTKVQAKNGGSNYIEISNIEMDDITANTYTIDLSKATKDKIDRKLGIKVGSNKSEDVLGKTIEFLGDSNISSKFDDKTNEITYSLNSELKGITSIENNNNGKGSKISLDGAENKIDFNNAKLTKVSSGLDIDSSKLNNNVIDKDKAHEAIEELTQNGSTISSKIHNVVTVGDLQALAIAGFNIVGTKGETHVNLGGSFNIVGIEKNGNGTTTAPTTFDVNSSKFSTQNVATNIDATNISIGIKERPEFKGIDIKDSDKNSNTVKIDADSISITKNGAGKDKTESSKLTASELKFESKDKNNGSDKSSTTINKLGVTITDEKGTDSIKLDGENKTIKVGEININGKDKSIGVNGNKISFGDVNGTGKSDTVTIFIGGAGVTFKNSNNNNGESNKVLISNVATPQNDYDAVNKKYVDGLIASGDKQNTVDSNRPFIFMLDGEEVVKAPNGKLYKKKDIEDATYDAKTNKFMKKSGKEPNSLRPDETKRVTIVGRSSESDNVPLKVGNIASGLGLDSSKDKNKVIEKTTAHDTVATLITNTTMLNNVATVRDLQALAIAGLDFVGSEGKAHINLGTTINIIGIEKENKANGGSIAYKSNSFNVNSSTFTTKNIATKVSDGKIEIGIKERPEFKAIDIKDDSKNGETVAIDTSGVTVTKNGTGKDKTESSKLTATDLTFGDKNTTNNGDKSSTTINKSGVTITDEKGTESIKLNGKDKTIQVGDVKIDGQKNSIGVDEKAQIIFDKGDSNGNKPKVNIKVDNASVTFEKDKENKVRISNVATPEADYDAVNKKYVDGKLKSTDDKLDNIDANRPFVYMLGKDEVVRGIDGKLYKKSDIDGATYDKNSKKYTKNNGGGEVNALNNDDVKKVIITARSTDPNNPIQISNIASGLGIDSNKYKNGLIDKDNAHLEIEKLTKNDGSISPMLNNVVTVGDLQALAIAGLDFVGSDGNTHRNLGTSVNIIGIEANGTNGNTTYKSTEFTLGKKEFSTKNVATKVEENNIRIGIKERPEFKAIDIKDDAKKGDSVKIEADSVTITKKDATNGKDKAESKLTATDLTFKDANGQDSVKIDAKEKSIKVGDVKIDGKNNSIGVDDNNQIAFDKGGNGKSAKATIKVDGASVTFEKSNNAGETDKVRISNVATPIKDYDAVNKKYVDDKLKATNDKLENVDANRPFIFTDKDGNEVVKGRDGQLYKKSDLEGATYDATKNEYTKSSKKVDKLTDEEAKKVVISARSMDSENKPIKIANVASGIGLEEGKDNKDKIDSVLNGKNTDKNVINVADLSQVSKAIIDKGLDFGADKGNIHKNLGDTVSIKGDSKNITTEVENGDIKVKLKDDINLNSVTTGNSKLDNSGLTVTNNTEKAKYTEKGVEISNEKGTSKLSSTNLEFTKKDGGKSVVVDGEKATITGLADLNENSHGSSAVNKNYVDNLEEKLTGEIGSASALNAALAALKPLSYDPLRKSQFSAGMGYYKGQTAFALGLNHYTSENTLINGGVSFASGSNINNRRDIMFNLGFTHKFGSKADIDKLPVEYQAGPISSVYVMQEQMQKVMQENSKLKTTVQTQAKENAEVIQKLEKQEKENAELKARMDKQEKQIQMLLKRIK